MLKSFRVWTYEVPDVAVVPTPWAPCRTNDTHERGDGRLPSEPADWITQAFKRFMSIEAMAGAILLGCTVVALVLANTGLSKAVTGFWEMKIGLHAGDFEMSRSLKHWINDGLMTLFFFLIALELKRELVLGELRQLRAAALPLAAGGRDGGARGRLPAGDAGRGGDRGWGTVMSTDTAFVIGCLALLGSRVPESLRLFILSLAIFDDVGAILVVTIGYSHGLNVIALGAAGLGLPRSGASRGSGYAACLSISRSAAAFGWRSTCRASMRLSPACSLAS